MTAAPTVTQSVDVVRKPQTITFTSTPPAEHNPRAGLAPPPPSQPVTSRRTRSSSPSVPAPRRARARCLRQCRPARRRREGVVAADRPGHVLRSGAGVTSPSPSPPTPGRRRSPTPSTNQCSASVAAPGVLANDADLRVTAVGGAGDGDAHRSLSLAGNGASPTPRRQLQRDGPVHLPGQRRRQVVDGRHRVVTVLDTSPPFITVPDPSPSTPRHGNTACTPTAPPPPTTRPRARRHLCGRRRLVLRHRDHLGELLRHRRRRQHGTASFTVTVKDDIPPMRPPAGTDHGRRRRVVRGRGRRLPGLRHRQDGREPGGHAARRRRARPSPSGPRR